MNKNHSSGLSNTWSLRKKIFLLALLNSLVGIVIYQLIIKKFADTARQIAETQMSALALSLGDAISGQFGERYSDTLAIAANPIFSTDIESDKLTSYLTKIVSTYPIYDFIAFIDKDGKLVAGSAPKMAENTLRIESLKNEDFSSSTWFKKAMNGEFSEEREKGYSGVYVDDIGVDPVTSKVFGENRIGLGFSTQVLDAQGSVVGVLTLRSSARWIEDRMKDVYKRANGSGNAEIEVVLLNKKGEIALLYNPAAQGGSLDFKHDFNVLFKRNLVSEKNEAALEVSAGKRGTLESSQTLNKVPQFSAFTPLAYGKFLTSLGWGAIIQQNRDTAFAWSERLLKLSYLAAVFLLTVVPFLIYLVAGRISKTFTTSIEKLCFEAAHTNTVSQQLADASHLVSSATSEQAAAVHETIAAISEMSSMITQTSHHARDAYQNAQVASQLTESGGVVIGKVKGSMDDIHQSNEQLLGLAKIIDDISVKTNVINDIVFKTQLLSFNASIEAARAGQHGRGFAVVAEEVGNLAQMSGSAAKEIDLLLQHSKKQVSQIVQDMQERVREGQSVSAEALVQFQEIALRVKVILEQAQSITQAGDEQEAGIKQTQKAMTQIDAGTRSNSQAADQAATASSELKERSHVLEEIASDLNRSISGSAMSPSSRTNAVDPGVTKKPMKLRESVPTTPSTAKAKKSATEEKSVSRHTEHKSSKNPEKHQEKSSAKARAEKILNAVSVNTKHVDAKDLLSELGKKSLRIRDIASEPKNDALDFSADDDFFKKHG